MLTSKKIAVIGFGDWGKNHARVLDELNVLSGIYDENKKSYESNKENYNEFNNIEELILNSDAAVIATPASTHFNLSKQLLEDLDLLVEKPLSLSKQECETLIKLAKKNKKILIVGHQLQFHEAVIKMKKLVEDNYIGEIKWVYSNRLNMGKIRTEENVMWSFAPHDISLMLSIIEEDIKSIEVQGTNIFNKNVEDASLTLIEFENGIKAHIFVSWFHPFKEQRFVLVGEKGTLVFSDTNKKNVLVSYITDLDKKNKNIIDHREEIIEFENNEPLKNQAMYFINALETRHAELNNGEHALKVVDVLETSTNLLKSQT